jgi:NitT/TauT family transport system substrate-binding protein
MLAFMRIGLLAAPLVALLAVAAPARASDHLTVQLAFYPQGPQAYLFLAKKKGWFKNAGLDVDILDGRGSNYSMQVLSSGHADVGEGELPPLIFAREKGADVKAVAEWFKAEGPSIVVPKESGIHSPADLKGKRVGIVAAGPWPPLLKSFLHQFELTPDDLSLVYVNGPSLFSTYATKRVDAIMTVDLAFTEADPLRPSIDLRSLDYGVKLPGDGLYVRADELTAKKDALSRFLRICQRSVAYIYDGHAAEAAQAIRDLRPNTKLGFERLREQIELFSAFRFTPSTKGKPEGWQSTEDWVERLAYLKKAGLLKGNPAPTDFFSNALLGQDGDKR